MHEVVLVPVTQSILLEWPLLEGYGSSPETILYCICHAHLIKISFSFQDSVSLCSLEACPGICSVD